MSPQTVWVVEVSPHPDDYYDHNVIEVAGVYVSLDAAQQHHPSPAWTHHEASPTGAEECWVSDDMATSITAMPVQGPPVRCRHCHEVDPVHDPECPACAAHQPQENP